MHIIWSLSSLFPLSVILRGKNEDLSNWFLITGDTVNREQSEVEKSQILE